MYIQADNESNTRSEFESFIGGIPKLPVGMGIPKCLNCKQQQTFFFQVAFPVDHLWQGSTLCCFACTQCAHEDYLIPEMLNQELRGADIPEGFLSSYQKNFVFLVFETSSAVLAVDKYKEVISFIGLTFSNKKTEDTIGIVGGKPDFLVENEAPATYNKSYRMYFLMQLFIGIKYPINPDALKQVELNLMNEPERSRADYYQLFLGNELYLFGSDDKKNGVYAITQVE